MYLVTLHHCSGHTVSCWTVQQQKISLEKKWSLSAMRPITGRSTKQRLTRLSDINIKVLVNSSPDLQEKRIATFSSEDLLQVFWIFYGGTEKKRKEKWSSFRKESIINQACIFWALLKKPNLIHPSCSNLYVILTCEGILTGGISGWFTRTFSWWIDLCKRSMYEVSFVPKMCVSFVFVYFPSYFLTVLHSCDFCILLLFDFVLICHLTWHITCP